MCSSTCQRVIQTCRDDPHLAPTHQAPATDLRGAGRLPLALLSRALTLDARAPLRRSGLGIAERRLRSQGANPDLFNVSGGTLLSELSEALLREGNAAKNDLEHYTPLLTASVQV